MDNNREFHNEHPEFWQEVNECLQRSKYFALCERVIISAEMKRQKVAMLKRLLQRMKRDGISLDLLRSLLDSENERLARQNEDDAPRKPIGKDASVEKTKQEKDTEAQANGGPDEARSRFLARKGKPQKPQTPARKLPRVRREMCRGLSAVPAPQAAEETQAPARQVPAPRTQEKAAPGETAVQLNIEAAGAVSIEIGRDGSIAIHIR